MDLLAGQNRLRAIETSDSARLKRRRAWLVSCAAAMLAVASPVRAAPSDDATLKLGQRVFLLCQSCHSMDAGGLNKIGPNLWGLFGRKAGSKADFHYSDALKNANVVWSEKTLDQWLTSPRDFIPGNRMAFGGVSDPEKRAALIAYLKQASAANP
jgi:cytochrome c